MELNLKNNPAWKEYRHPKSGALSFVLENTPADFVKNLYFTNPSLSKDNRHLWLAGFFPPVLKHTILCAVSLDSKNPFSRQFPGAVFDDASPLVAPDGESAFFSKGEGIYRVRIDGNIEAFAMLPEHIRKNRPVFKMATHLTISADGKFMLLDINVGNEYLITLLDMKTKEFRVLKEFATYYDHAQFSPVDPKTFSLDQDWFHDKVSGHYFEFDHRMWMMDTEGTRFEPILPKKWFKHGSLICHDFWSGDGRLCFVDFEEGAFEIDPETLEAVHVWNGPLCHAHCSADRKLWVADESPYKWDKAPCKVLFFNRESGMETEIFSLPAPSVPRGGWHLDPHPQFSPDDKNIVTTITLGGKATVAITPVEQFVV